MTASPWPHFSIEELSCSHCKKMHMDDSMMWNLVGVRETLGFPLPVTSGYRCPEYNAQISTTGRNGPHTTGKAVDIAISHENALALVYTALRLGFTGLGVKQKGANRFIHIDTLEEGPRPTIWSY